MCFYFPSNKDHDNLDSEGRKPEWRQVRVRSGGKVVRRQILRGNRVVYSESRSPRAVIPRAMLGTICRTVYADCGNEEEEEEKVEEVVVNAKGIHTDSRPRDRGLVSTRGARKSPSRRTKKASKTSDREAETTTGVPEWGKFSDWASENDSFILQHPYIKREHSESNRAGDKQDDKGSGDKEAVFHKKGEKFQDNVCGDGHPTNGYWANGDNDQTENEVVCDYNGLTDWDSKVVGHEDSAGCINAAERAPANQDFEEWPPLSEQGTIDGGKQDGAGDCHQGGQATGATPTEEGTSKQNRTMAVPGSWPDTGTEKSSEKDVDPVRTEKTPGQSQNDSRPQSQHESKIPRVRCLGTEQVVEFCVREADNTYTYRNVQQILEDCQPGQWQQDENGNPFFQRAQPADDISQHDADIKPGFTPEPDDEPRGMW